MISRTVPGADVIYSLLNLSTDNPAEDLEISNFVAKITRDEATGHNVIDLTATIFNQSQYPVNAPTLMVIPIDDVGSQMEPMRFRLQELVLEPGQNINFKKSFDNWPSNAASAVLSVADTAECRHHQILRADRLSFQSYAGALRRSARKGRVEPE